MKIKLFVENLYLLIFLFAGFVEKTDGALPAVLNWPRTFYVGGGETETRLIDPLETTSDTAAINCTITSVPQADFYASQDPDTLEWGLWLVDGVTLDTASDYTLTAVCTDANLVSSTPVTATVVVRPVGVFLAPDSHSKTGIATLTTAVNTAITDVDCSPNDPTNTVTYTMPTTSEYFSVDSTSGIITTKKSLETIDTLTRSLVLTITCSDDVTQILQYNYITLNFTNQNTKPFTTTLPLTLEVAEDITTSTVLFTLVNGDPDSQTFTYRHVCNPTAAEDMFTDLTTSDLTFRLKSGKVLDYETLPNITCTIYIHDGIEESNGDTFKLGITNVNEKPKFSKSTYYATLTEELFESFNPTLVCTDVDAGDSTYFALDPAINGSTRINMETNGNISFATTFDRDAAQESELTLRVLCIDSGGVTGEPKTGTASLVLTIVDVNDNAPTFTEDTTVIYVNDSAVLGSLVGVATVTDLDEGINADITCSATSSSAYKTYYEVITITNPVGCAVYASKTPDFGGDVNIIYKVVATDKGDPQMSSTSTIQLVYEQTSTTTVTTTTSGDWFDDGRNVAAFVGALLGGLLALALLTFCVLKYCCNGGAYMDCCDDCRSGRRRRRPRYPKRDSYRRERSITPPPKKTPTYDIFSGYRPEPAPRRIAYVPRGMGPSRIMYPGPQPALPGFVG